MKQEALIRLFLTSCLVILTGCTPPSNGFTATAPNPENFSPEVPGTTSTLPVIIQAVVEENLTCFFGNGEGYDVNLPQFQIVKVVGRSSTSYWILVKSEEFADCWIETSLLYFQPGIDINALPIITQLSSPIITPTVLPSPVVTAQLDPLELQWKVLSYDCNDRGEVTSITIDLDVTGGISPYKFSPELPIHALPEQRVSIVVSSNTDDGEPSKTITFNTPRSADFKCKGTGHNPGPPTPRSTEPSDPTRVPRCSDGRDNDHDGKTDMEDPECSSPNDNTERHPN
jgi:hypothetical protein